MPFDDLMNDIVKVLKQDGVIIPDIKSSVQRGWLQSLGRRCGPEQLEADAEAHGRAEVRTVAVERAARGGQQIAASVVSRRLIESRRRKLEGCRRALPVDVHRHVHDADALDRRAA